MFPEAIGDVANSKRPRLIIVKVQLCLRVPAHYCSFLPTEVGKIFSYFLKLVRLRKRSCVLTVNNREYLELATSAIDINVINSDAYFIQKTQHSLLLNFMLTLFLTRVIGGGVVITIAIV